MSNVRCQMSDLALKAALPCLTLLYHTNEALITGGPLLFCLEAAAVMFAFCKVCEEI
jgi:hypothetical protein